MNHLTEEELMLYLFDRTRLPDGEAIEAHINGCAECQERVAMENTLEQDLRWSRLAVARVLAVDPRELR